MKPKFQESKPSVTLYSTLRQARVMYEMLKGGCSVYE